jgi:acyl-CoA thioester hydrolase
VSNGAFRYFLRVRYGECDAQKVVFNARYGDYIDAAVYEFTRALGYGENAGLARFDYQLVRQTIEWKAPARFDDVLEVSVNTRALGTTSFTLGCEFRRAGETPLLAQAETVYVNVDPVTLSKIPLDAALRAALQRGAVGCITDHAGHTAAAPVLTAPAAQAPDGQSPER